MISIILLERVQVGEKAKGTWAVPPPGWPRGHPGKAHPGEVLSPAAPGERLWPLVPRNAIFCGAQRSFQALQHREKAVKKLLGRVYFVI